MKNLVKIDSKKITQISNYILEHLFGYKKSRLKQIAKIYGCLKLSVGYAVDWGTDIKLGTSVFNLANPLDNSCANLGITPQSRRYSVTWKEFEEGKFLEAINEIKELAAIPLEGDLTLSQIINGYKNYTGFVYEERHYEDPALIAAWAGRPEVAKDCLEWGLAGVKEKYGNNGIYKNGNSMTIDEWYADMQTKIANPDKLHQDVEDQIIHHKLTKVPRYDIIIDM
ncbi:MAG: hypothetical protein KF798_06620 [Candidatus Paracaedibacteraceae bacterium]|nr:hypothetical protein [Candidatus Paracaedibacteraceae bacterium]